MLISERIEELVNKKVSEEENIPLNVIEKLNTFQWKIIHEATYLHNEIEISELGRLKIYQTRVKNKLDKLLLREALLEKELEVETNENKIKNKKMILEGTRITIKHLQTKLVE